MSVNVSANSVFLALSLWLQLNGPRLTDLSATDGGSEAYTFIAHRHRFLRSHATHRNLCVAAYSYRQLPCEHACIGI